MWHLIKRDQCKISEFSREGMSIASFGNLDLLLDHMIEHVKFGIRHRVKNCIHLKDIRMSFMLLHSTFLMGGKFLSRKIVELCACA